MGTADRLGRFEPKRPALLSAGSPARHGQALYAAQQGEIDPSAKPLKGFGGGSVLEIVAEDRGGTWRAVYTVRFGEAIWFTRFPEEIEARDRDPGEGHESHSAAPGRGRTTPPGKAELT